MCARVSSKKRGKRDQRWYLSSLCISITCPPASLLLSLHLSPLFPQLSQENYNLTAHFNISASKWVWQPLLCVPPHPHLTASSVPTSIHPPTHPALSLPAPASSCRLLIIPPTVQLLPCDRRETDRDGKKQKQIRLKPRSLCQAIRLSLCEFCDMYTTMNLQWGAVSLRADVCHSWSDIDTQAAFHSDSWGSDLIHRDRHWLRIEVCVCPFVYLCIRCHPLYMSHFSAWDTSEKALSAAITPIVFSMHAHACYC